MAWPAGRSTPRRRPTPCARGLHTRLARYLWAAGTRRGGVAHGARAVELMPAEPTAERAVALEAHARLVMLSGRRMES